MPYLTKKLPSNFRFIFTCCQDCLSGNIIPIIERACESSCLFLKPHQVTVQQEPGQRADQLLVYNTVMAECKLTGPLETAPTLNNLYEAYKRVFLAKENTASAGNLLQVLLVTCEPPPMSLLQGLGLEKHLKRTFQAGPLYFTNQITVCIFSISLL